MDFCSLVIMERDKEKNILIKELDQLDAVEGCQYIEKLYVEDNELVIYVTTLKDVSDDEFEAFYDEFNIEPFKGLCTEIKDLDDVYNPTFIFKMKYIDDHNMMQESFNKFCALINEEFGKY